MAPVFSDQTPTRPPEFDSLRYRAAFDNSFRRSFYYWHHGLDGELSDPAMRTSVLEYGLRDALTSLSNELPPRSYVAIVELSTEIPLGVRSAREESSFHVIVGRW
jgi:hypothetical protein